MSITEMLTHMPEFEEQEYINNLWRDFFHGLYFLLLCIIRHIFSLLIDLSENA